MIVLGTTQGATPTNSSSSREGRGKSQMERPRSRNGGKTNLCDKFDSRQPIDDAQKLCCSNRQIDRSSHNTDPFTPNYGHALNIFGADTAPLNRWPAPRLKLTLAQEATRALLR